MEKFHQIQLLWNQRLLLNRDPAVVHFRKWILQMGNGTLRNPHGRIPYDIHDDDRIIIPSLLYKTKNVIYLINDVYDDCNITNNSLNSSPNDVY